MTISKADAESLRMAAEELVDEFVHSGMTRPVLPRCRRGDVIGFLTRLMADKELLTMYCEVLDSERERQHVDRLLRVPFQDIPDTEIAAHGFVNLTDDQLADFALSPSALRAIVEHLYENEGLQPGDWLADAVLMDLRLRSNAVGGGSFPGAEAVSHLVGEPRWERLNALDTARDWLADDDEPIRPLDRLELTVRNDSDARVFVTVVGLNESTGPIGVLYHDDDHYLAIAPGGLIVLRDLVLREHFGSPEVALVVLTPVPAGDPVKRSLPFSDAAERPERLDEHVSSALEALGIRSIVRFEEIRRVARPSDRWLPPPSE